MTGVVSVLAALAILFAVGVGGFMAGRDAAERRAGYTIANLRRRNASLVSQRDRMATQNARLSRTLGVVQLPTVREPEWMRDA